MIADRVSRRASWAVSFIVVACALSIVSGCVSPDQYVVAETPVVISVIGTNDLHGALLPSRGHGGVAVFSGFLSNLRAEREAGGGAVLLLDAGDMWQGTIESNLFEGASVVQVYNALGYSAVTVGNHEFDFGPEGPLPTPRSNTDDPQGALKKRAEESKFPVLTANILDSETDEPVKWPNVSPSVLKEVAGVKVGIIGALSEFALPTIVTANAAGVRIDGVASSVQREAERLRGEGATIVVVVAHAGGRCSEFDDPDDLSKCQLAGEIFQVVQSLPRGLVDVIVGGHIHDAIAHNVNDTAVIASYAHGRAFGRVDLHIDRSNGVVQSKSIRRPEGICEFQSQSGAVCGSAENADPRTVYAGKDVVRDAAIDEIVDSVIGDTALKKDQKLGVVVESPINTRNYPDSPAGNLVTDIVLDAVEGADVAIFNTVGGVRASVPVGELTFGRVFEVAPFDNAIVKFTLSGAQLKTVFEGQFRGRRGGFGTTNLAGASLTADCKKGVPQISIVRNNGVEIKDDEFLTIATTDFLATGGGRVLSPVTPEGGLDFQYVSSSYREEMVSWFEARRTSFKSESYTESVARRILVTRDYASGCTSAGEPAHGT